MNFFMRNEIKNFRCAVGCLLLENKILYNLSTVPKSMIKDCKNSNSNIPFISNCMCLIAGLLKVIL